jgi:hypothetical protein
MKLAFLFLTITNIYHERCWVNFFKDYQKQYSIYIHSKYPMRNSAFKKYELPTKAPTTWANTMRAQIELLKAALKDPKNTKFIFISDSTVPLQTFDYVYDSLMKHPHSQFDFSPNPNKDRTFYPIPPFKYYKNSQWIVLNRKHAEMIAKDLHYINIFDRYGFDNEHYPSIFLIDQRVSHEIIRRDTTLVIWYKFLPHPHMFTEIANDIYSQQLIQAITSKQYLFARKFAPTCNLSTLAQYRPELFGTLAL